ncbi:MAG: ABC transporter permease [Oscillospiraceae bacterium]
MTFVESLRQAIKNIWASKMRTFLTMLGIIIGVTAVIVITGLGNGMEIYMEESFADLGTNTLNVMVMGRGSSSRSISVEDIYAVADENPDYFDHVSPMVEMSGPVKIGTEEAKKTGVTGVSEDFFKIRSYEVAAGRGLEYVDITARRHVCVVGSYVADTWFGGDAVGKSLKIGGDRLTIVGVLAQEADKKSEEGGTDDAVYLPYSTAARLSGMGSIGGYILTVHNKDTAAISKGLVEDALYRVFEDTDAYTVISMVEMMDMMNTMIDMNVTILTIIAAISLVVGGIGIMNIMLVSVTERTREIGIRKALGAKERSIMEQFVIEAALTSALGGILGILLGYALSAAATVLIAQLMQVNLPVTPTAQSICVAVGVSAAIGIAFGYLPAKKAARLNPIDALHFD